MDMPFMGMEVSQKPDLCLCSFAHVPLNQTFPLSASTYHQQGQDEDDGAAQVGVLVQPGFVLGVVDQLQSQLLLQKIIYSSQKWERKDPAVLCAPCVSGHMG